MGYKPEEMFGLAKPDGPTYTNPYGQVKKLKVPTAGSASVRDKASPVDRKILLWAWRTVKDPLSDRMVVEHWRRMVSTRAIAEEMALLLGRPENGGWTVSFDVSKPPKSHKHLLA